LECLLAFSRLLLEFSYIAEYRGLADAVVRGLCGRKRLVVEVERLLKFAQQVVIKKSDPDKRSLLELPIACSACKRARLVIGTHRLFGVIARVECTDQAECLSQRSAVADCTAERERRFCVLERAMRITEKSIDRGYLEETVRLPSPITNGVPQRCALFELFD